MVVFGLLFCALTAGGIGWAWSGSGLSTEALSRLFRLPPDLLTLIAVCAVGLLVADTVRYLLVAWAQITTSLVLGIPVETPLIAGAYAILLTVIVVYGVINFFIERSFARARAMRRINALSAEEEAEAAAAAAAPI